MNINYYSTQLPSNIFNPLTWNKPGHGTENHGAAKKAKEQGDK